MAIFLWILLGIQIADILFAVVQLFMLDTMRLVVYDMNLRDKWSFALLSPLLVLAAIIAAIHLSAFPESHSLQIVFWTACVGFVLLVCFQGVLMVPILRKLREWEAAIERRNLAVRQEVSR